MAVGQQGNKGTFSSPGRRCPQLSATPVQTVFNGLAKRSEVFGNLELSFEKEKRRPLNPRATSVNPTSCCYTVTWEGKTMRSWIDKQ